MDRTLSTQLSSFGGGASGPRKLRSFQTQIRFQVTGFDSVAAQLKAIAAIKILAYSKSGKNLRHLRSHCNDTIGLIPKNVKG